MVKCSNCGKEVEFVCAACGRCKKCGDEFCRVHMRRIADGKTTGSFSDRKRSK